MKVKLKLFGDLRQYLPAGSGFNAADLILPEGAVVQQALDKVTFPAGKTYLVMLNGDLVQATHYARQALNAGDEVTLFPPIKGG